MVARSKGLMLLPQKSYLQSLYESFSHSEGSDHQIVFRLIQYYVKPLTRLINSSFENGLFPDELKIAKVIPTGDKKDTVNYRPISILTSFSKIFEKTMYNHLISLIDQEDILYKFQFGFRKSHYTNHVIISLVEKVNQVLCGPQGYILGP